MKYPFDVLVDKTGSANLKLFHSNELIESKGLYTFGGAEMDFATAPSVIEAFKVRADNGLFGVTVADEIALKTKVQWWMKNRRSWDIDTDWVVTCPGTIGAIKLVILALTQPGEGVIVQPPVYLAYKHQIELHGRNLVENIIRKADDQKYYMDFEDLEEKMKDKNNKLIVMCNPSNPTGTVYGKEILSRVASLARKYGVYMGGDEIFGELTADHKGAVPLASVPEAKDIAVSVTSLGKTFNLTGMPEANAIIPNPEIREKVKAELKKEIYHNINPFTRAAYFGAYNEEGAAWLDAAIDYIGENIRMFTDFIHENLPMVKISPWEGSYLTWIDWNGLYTNEAELHKFLKEEAYLGIDAGGRYHKTASCMTRMNMAGPRWIYEKVIDYLYAACKNKGYIK